MTDITYPPAEAFLQVSGIVGVSCGLRSGVPFASFSATLSERPPREAPPLSWQWSRSPAGIWLEIAPSALSAVFALDERTRRSLQSRLFAIAELATVHPVPGPAMNLIAGAARFVVRYSLDLAGKRIVIDALAQPDRSRLGLAG